MPVKPKDSCVLRRSGLKDLKNSITLFCAGFRQGSSTCKGDDGTGLVMKVNNIWYLRGIDSCSIGYQEEVICDANHYAAITDVVPFISWIDANK